MKKILLSITLIVLFISLVQAHPPAKFNYQGIARNSKGFPIANQIIAFRISIIEMIKTNSTVVYTETHIDTTNAFGLFTIEVGGGLVVTGKMDGINWALGEKYMRVEMDPAGGSAYVMLGTSRLLTVPFARRAEDAGMISIYAGSELMHANPNKMIIRHSAAYPTWGLYYNDADAQFNFLKAGISVMDIDLGANIVSIHGGLKISSATAGPGKVLTADSTGIATWQDFTTKVSAFQPAGCQSLSNVTAVFEKIADMGTFTKSIVNSFIELDVQTNVYSTTFVGATGVVFELRVDGAATTIGNATALIRTAGTFEPIHITGVFTGLANGTHIVSLWAKALNGTATNAGWDEGCLNSAGTNNVLVKEFK